MDVRSFARGAGAAAHEKTAGLPHVQTGPRGGTFYLTSKGTKVYGTPPVAGEKTHRAFTEKLPPGVKDDETYKTHYDKAPDKGGKPSKERLEKVQEPIMREALDVKPAAPGEQKLAIMTMGAPASGKSSALKGVDTSKFVKVDPDAIKEKLPEYQKAISDRSATYVHAAEMAHEESSDIAKRIMAKAIASGNHIIVDGTGSDSAKFLKKMEQLKAAGYHVHVTMPHLDEEAGIARLKARADATGRMVPEKFAREAYRSIPKNFEKITEQADSFALYDNSGKEPRKVFEGSKAGGNVEHDPSFMKRFRSKYGGG
jgi:predicted ABC-type ATPase